MILQVEIALLRWTFQQVMDGMRNELGAAKKDRDQAVAECAFVTGQLKEALMRLELEKEKNVLAERKIEALASKQVRPS